MLGALSCKYKYKYSHQSQIQIEKLADYLGSILMLGTLSLVAASSASSSLIASEYSCNLIKIVNIFVAVDFLKIVGSFVLFI